MKSYMIRTHILSLKNSARVRERFIERSKYPPKFARYAINARSLFNLNNSELQADLVCIGESTLDDYTGRSFCNRLSCA
jgi:hypothetical protein